MNGRALLLDVGNTRVKWGVLEDGALKRTGSVPHEKLRERGIETLTRRLPRRVEAALACNVAGPDVGKRLARAIGIHIRGDLRFAHSERRACGVTNGYRRPRSLGVDRWVAMIGARADYDGPLCVVDAGTAVTIDALDGDGTHVGGQIIPGLRLMGDALSKDTSDIGAARRRPVSIASPADLFARSTALAVACGSLSAVCGAIERAADALADIGPEPTLVLTGGDAARILAVLGRDSEHNPHLVLRGLARMIGESS